MASDCNLLEVTYCLLKYCCPPLYLPCNSSVALLHCKACSVHPLLLIQPHLLALHSCQSAGYNSHPVFAISLALPTTSFYDCDASPFVLYTPTYSANRSSSLLNTNAVATTRSVWLLVSMASTVHCAECYYDNSILAKIVSYVVIPTPLCYLLYCNWGGGALYTYVPWMVSQQNA